MRRLALKVATHTLREAGASVPLAEAAAVAAVQTFEAGALKVWEHQHCSSCIHTMLRCRFLPEDNPGVLTLHLQRVVYADLRSCPQHESR